MPVRELPAMIRPPGGKAARIGLALAGSGLRASYFHLGAIRMLEELGIMAHVEVLSLTSGGSIAGTYYTVQMQQRLRQDPSTARTENCDAIITEFCQRTELGLAGCRGGLKALWEPLAGVLSQVGKRRTGLAWEESLKRHLFPETPSLLDLPYEEHDETQEIGPFRTAPRVLINATALSDGRRIVYGRGRTASVTEEVDHADGLRDVPLARAVAASSADVDLFDPVTISERKLVDGGVADNQSIESLLDYFELSPPEHNELNLSLRQPDNHLRGPIYLLICDGSAPPRSQGASRGVSSVVHLLQTENRRRVLAWLCDHVNSDDDDATLAGMSLIHPRMEVDRQRTPGLPSSVVRALGTMRAGVGDYTRSEREFLLYHGYTLQLSHLRKHCAALLPQRTNLTQLNSEQLSLPPKLLEACSAEEKEDTMLRHLQLSRALWLRSFRRHPWLMLSFLPMLLLVFRGLLHACFWPFSKQSLYTEWVARTRQFLGTMRGSFWDQILHVGIAGLCVAGCVVATSWLYLRLRSLLRFDQQAEDAFLQRLAKRL